ncbi:hypothetical protein AAHK20_07215 [Trinickia sp. YCB016]
MAQLEMTLWQTIDALVEAIPLTRVKVENVLKIRFVDSDPSNYAIQPSSFQPLDGGPVKLSDGVVIGNVDLRIKREEGHPGFLVLDSLGGECIKLDAVRARYGNLRITDFPRGRSLDEATSYSAFPAWGKLSFGFTERNPDCLAYVVINPKTPDIGNVVK